MFETRFSIVYCERSRNLVRTKCPWSSLVSVLMVLRVNMLQRAFYKIPILHSRKKVTSYYTPITPTYPSLYNSHFPLSPGWPVSGSTVQVISAFQAKIAIKNALLSNSYSTKQDWREPTADEMYIPHQEPIWAPVPHWFCKPEITATSSWQIPGLQQRLQTQNQAGGCPSTHDPSTQCHSRLTNGWQQRNTFCWYPS